MIPISQKTSKNCSIQDMNNKPMIPKTETSSEPCQTSKLELFANIQGMSNIYLKITTEKNLRSRNFEAMLKI